MPEYTHTHTHMHIHVNFYILRFGRVIKGKPGKWGEDGETTYCDKLLKT